MCLRVYLRRCQTVGRQSISRLLCWASEGRQNTAQRRPCPLALNAGIRHSADSRCGIRKVNPLRRKLATVDAWITGQRKDQSPGTRNDVPVVQIDDAFSTDEKTLVKFNPLANWSSKEVWDYIRMTEAPYNKLHEKGFVSIGCEPCTRPILPGQHEREGRWWWEEATQKECGLHAGNLIARE